MFSLCNTEKQVFFLPGSPSHNSFCFLNRCKRNTFKFSQHNADMASVNISTGRVVCQLASLCKLWGCRRRQLAGPGCEKQTHLVKLHPYYLIRWCNEGEGFSLCLQASGYVLRERCQRASARHKSRKTQKKEVGQCTGGVTTSPQRRWSHGGVSRRIVFSLICVGACTLYA